MSAVEEITGTSAAMIKAHYYHVLQNHLRKKLKNRQSI
jgi:hypothetical protein